MLVVSKPRSNCQFGASKQSQVSFLGCFGFPLRTMFHVPVKQGPKSRCLHGHVVSGSGLREFAEPETACDDKWARCSPMSSATTSASEGTLSPCLSYVEECLPELSAELPRDLSISGTLAATLRSVALAKASALRN